ncbi:MAG TPA: SWIM zinc finger family protein, partial [Candidatus Acidoferrales bacterium]|nr:SWIM zinc finger family protein [Candidatus Acidoferrales bacterium]
MLAHQQTREERGQTIASTNGQINRIDEIFYIVKSQSGNGEYTVNKINNEWVCDCPDNTYRHVPCKHILAVTFSQRVRAEVAIQRIEPLGTLTACIYCGSQNLMRAGIRKNKS